MSKMLVIGAAAMLLQVGDAAAFWNPFAAPAPTVTASYDPSACTGQGKILVVVQNPTGEALARHSYNIVIYKPQFSDPMGSIRQRTTQIVPANSSQANCHDIERTNVVSFLSVENGGMSYWDLTVKYGDPLDYRGREFLSDAIFKTEVTEYEYGLPY